MLYFDTELCPPPYLGHSMEKPQWTGKKCMTQIMDLRSRARAPQHNSLGTLVKADLKNVAIISEGRNRGGRSIITV